MGAMTMRSLMAIAFAQSNDPAAGWQTDCLFLALEQNSGIDLQDLGQALDHFHRW